MLIRLLAIFILAILPLTATADDSSDPGAAPTDTPAASAAPAPDTQAPSSANNLLGPSAGASGGSGTGGSHSDAPSLQPAGQSPLQSTSNDSNGLVAPSNVLQAPAASDQQLQVLQGEADGEPVQVSDSTGPSIWGWVAITLAIAILVTAAVFVGLRRPRRLPSPGTFRFPRLRLPKLRLAGQPSKPKSKRKSRRKSRR